MTVSIYGGVGTKQGGAGRRRKQRHSRASLMSEINVTPFVDVMLVLLIIFMVTAPLLTSGVQVNLPKASAKSLTGQDEPLMVSITKDRDVYIQKNKVKLAKLAAKLIAITDRNMDARVFVRGDKDVDYGYVMTVMSAINKAGFTKVGLVTDSE